RAIRCTLGPRISIDLVDARIKIDGVGKENRSGTDLDLRDEIEVDTPIVIRVVRIRSGADADGVGLRIRLSASLAAGAYGQCVSGDNVGTGQHVGLCGVVEPAGRLRNLSRNRATAR